MNSNSPIARYQDIVVQELKDEILICNLKNNRVFCLNQTAAEVWKLCDGQNSTQQITKILSKKFNRKINEDVIFLALDELSKENLIEKNISSKPFYNTVTRREVIRRIGVSSLIAIPIISSVTMPTAAHAQSGDPCAIDPSDVGCPCVDNGDCGGGFGIRKYCDLDTLTCQPLPFCATPGGCPSNLACCNVGDTCSYGC